VQQRIQNLTYHLMARRLDWPERATVPDSLAAVAPYLRAALRGEAVLTVGNPVHEWQKERIDAVVSVGPLECMPNKIAEAQFFHVAEQEGLLTLNLSLNGDPVDDEVLDNFAFEVHARFAKKRQGGRNAPAPRAAAPAPDHEPLPSCRSKPHRSQASGIDPCALAGPCPCKTEGLVSPSKE
jgi:hypothetical protein